MTSKVDLLAQVRRITARLCGLLTCAGCSGPLEHAWRARVCSHALCGTCALERRCVVPGCTVPGDPGDVVVDRDVRSVYEAAAGIVREFQERPANSVFREGPVGVEDDCFDVEERLDMQRVRKGSKRKNGVRGEMVSAKRARSCVLRLRIRPLEMTVGGAKDAKVVAVEKSMDIQPIQSAFQKGSDLLVPVIRSDAEADAQDMAAPQREMRCPLKLRVRPSLPKARVSDNQDSTLSALLETENVHPVQSVAPARQKALSELVMSSTQPGGQLRLSAAPDEEIPWGHLNRQTVSVASEQSGQQRAPESAVPSPKAGCDSGTGRGERKVHIVHSSYQKAPESGNWTSTLRATSTPPAGPTSPSVSPVQDWSQLQSPALAVHSQGTAGGLPPNSPIDFVLQDNDIDHRSFTVCITKVTVESGEYQHACEVAMKIGAEIVSSFTRGSSSVVVTPLKPNTREVMRLSMPVHDAAAGRVPIVEPAWLDECAAAGGWIPTGAYEAVSGHRVDGPPVFDGVLATLDSGFDVDASDEVMTLGVDIRRLLAVGGGSVVARGAAPPKEWASKYRLYVHIMHDYDADEERGVHADAKLVDFAWISDCLLTGQCPPRNADMFESMGALSEPSPTSSPLDALRGVGDDTIAQQ